MQSRLNVRPIPTVLSYLDRLRSFITSIFFCQKQLRNRSENSQPNSVFKQQRKKAGKQHVLFIIAIDLKQN